MLLRTHSVMRAVHPLVSVRYAARSASLSPLSANLNHSTQHRSLHTASTSLKAAAAPGSTATSTPPPPPLPQPKPDSTGSSESGGVFQRARQWLQEQPPALRYTIVGVVVVLGTLESSFWLYNGYLRLQNYQAGRQHDKSEAAEVAVTEK